MKESKISKLKVLSKKVVLGGLTLLYSERAHQHKKNSLKYRRASQEYKNRLEEIVGYKNGFSIKNELKKFGTKIALNYLISSSNSKANQQWEKSLKYRKTAQKYSNRFEELMGYKNRLEETTTRKESNSPNLETAINKDYHTPIKESYQKYEEKNDTLTSTIGKILSGDYIENGQRIWYWKDRVRKIREYVGNNQLPETTQRQIFEILKKDRYFMRQKYNELSELNNILFRENGINREIREYISNRTRQPQ